MVGREGIVIAESGESASTLVMPRRLRLDRDLPIAERQFNAKIIEHLLAPKDWQQLYEKKGLFRRQNRPRGHFHGAACVTTRNERSNDLCYKGLRRVSSQSAACGSRVKGKCSTDTPSVPGISHSRARRSLVKTSRLTPVTHGDVCSRVSRESAAGSVI
jgi:hypothetical protein